jgi:hypothetical protein
MVDLKSVPANLDDLRMWGRSIRSYKGAVGAGMFEPPEPMIGGGLDALIPLHNAEHVRLLWDAGSIGGKDNPKSGWHLIEKYEKFSLGLLSYKLRPRFFSGSKWLTRFDIWFEMNDDVLRKKTVRKTGIGFSNTKTIPEVIPLGRSVKPDRLI